MSRNRSPKNAESRAGQEGFTLLEVLAAVIILGIALLAIASGETTSLSTSRLSREVSLATMVGDEILERMHRNRTSLSSYDGFDSTNAATRPATAGMLQTDYDAWKVRIERSAPDGLPGGRGVVSVTTGSPIGNATQVSVTVTWGTPSRSTTIRTAF